MDKSGVETTMARHVEYSVVVPVYNSAESLPELVERVDAVFARVVRDSYEIIMVDDGSTNPSTWSTIEDLARRHQALRAYQLTRNFGKPGAMLCGLKEAAGRFIITMDDDLQNRPEDIPALISQKGHDVVIGSYKDKKHGLLVRTTSEIKGWFEQAITGRPRHIKNSPFKLLKAEVVRAMLQIRTPYPFIPAMIYYVTKDAVCVDMEHGERKYGKPSYTFSKRAGQFMRLLINNSSLLLQAVAAVGITMSFMSVLYSIFIIIKKLFFGISVSGWTSLMVVMLITSGITLFSLGVVGEYLIRIVNGVESRPPYIVRRETGGI